jgi:hypothetical protein
MSPLSAQHERNFVYYSDIDHGRIIVYNVIAINSKEEIHMAPNPITEAALTELSIMREKIKVVLDCIIDDTNAREQTLTYIASDYLVTMGEMIQSMLKAHLTPTHE